MFWLACLVCDQFRLVKWPLKFERSDKIYFWSSADPKKSWEEDQSVQKQDFPAIRYLRINK